MINNIKENLIQSLENVFKAYDSNVLSLISKRDELIDDIARLTKMGEDVVANMKGIDVDLEARKARVNKLEEELQKDRDAVNAQLRFLDAEKQKAHKELADVRKECNSLTSEIASMVSKKAELDTLNISKEYHVKELNMLNAKILEARDELKARQDEMNAIEAEHSDTLKESLSTLAKVNAEIDSKKPWIMDKLDFIDKKEKELADKAKGLAIVEERYRKLYTEKGAGFKI